MSRDSKSDYEPPREDPQDYRPFDVLADFVDQVKELAPSARQGDRHALDDLIESMLRIGRSRLMNRLDIDDVIQDLFVKVLEVAPNLPRKDDDGQEEIPGPPEDDEAKKKNKTPLYQNIIQAMRNGNSLALARHLKVAMRYKAGDSNTRRKRRGKFERAASPEIDDGVMLSGARSGGQTTPLNQMIDDEELDNLHHAVDQLGDRDRKIVAAILDGQSHRQIAETLGITEQRSRQLLVAVKKKLRRIMCPNGDGDDGV